MASQNSLAAESPAAATASASAPAAAEPTPRPNPNNTPSNRQENGYWYDSFPSYNTALARNFNGLFAVAGTSAAGGKSGGARALGPDLLRGLLMMLMAFDHAALALHTWLHGTGRVSEADGQIVKEWNYTTAYIVRTLTHLCAPGFTFLLGMGVVYLGRSRTKLGWGPMRLARYFAERCAVLTIVNTAMGFLMSAGRVWFMNIVLFSLAVDYLLAGLLWLVINTTEGMLTRLIAKARKTWQNRSTDDESSDDNDEESVTQPLLHEREAINREASTGSYDAYLSWTTHNFLLLALGLVAIFWNIWLSDDGGSCRPAVSASTKSPSSPLLRIWFWVLMEPGSHVLSGFPPMAWLSFAIFGILYGRIVTARSWSRQASVLGHSFAGICFSILFVLTRVLRFGNLSEGCLQTPDQEARPNQNPYLASPRSFFYVVKYPPDVAFFAFTMAGNLFLLAVFTAAPPRIAKRFTMLLDFGTSALFFYVVHLATLFGLGMIAVALFGHDTGIPDPMNRGNTKGIDNLFGYFGFWALVMLLLWPVCRWYSRFKSGKPADSIWRFF
ncbi:hypothetical protein QQS21_000860 [Conoideocrella luteorostrata]|uniref:Heparan-alpha-glucosaminide N-acetyltransferase catalytic domain-containing protein n=1 Tax=Conoideocrella luteorostrata TaxID=1105319 RepID=A0AAJ0D0I3_9HYPO|nr:hypothetical protein QQS21_000860 [Conoideocrella luteorostrata]